MKPAKERGRAQKIKKYLAFLGILLAISLAANKTFALSLKEFFEQPLPNVLEFMDKAGIWIKNWSFEAWEFLKNIYNWSLENILAKIWQGIIWLGTTVKNGITGGLNFVVEIFKKILGR